MLRLRAQASWLLILFWIPSVFAGLPAPVENALLKARTLKDFYEKLSPFVTEDEIRAARDLMGEEFYARMPRVRKSGAGVYVLQGDGGSATLKFGEPGSGRFHVDGREFQVRAAEGLAANLRRILAEVKSSASRRGSPWTELLLPRAEAVGPLVLLLPILGGATGTGAWIAWDRYSTASSNCDDLNTLVNNCNEPLRQLMQIIQRCRRASREPMQREIRAAEERARRARTPHAAAQARLDVENLKKGFADLSNDGSTAPCNLTDEQKDEDRYTGAENAASTHYWEVVSKLQNASTRQAMTVMCEQHRESLRSCRDRLRRAGEILGMDFPVNRVNGGSSAPASPGRQ